MGLSETTLLEIIRVQQEIVETDPALEHVMNVVARAALRLTGADAAAVELMEGDAMVYRAGAGLAASHTGLRLDANASLSGLCVRLGEPLRCDDCETDPRVDREACHRVGARSLLVAPLHYRGAPEGVLKVYASRVAAFDDETAETLRLLVGIIAASLQRAREHEQLTQRAEHDPLTGLANREHLELAMSTRIRRDQPFTIAFLDLDGFKRINDEYGHAIGDEVLRSVAERVQSALRGADVAARLGGDELVILLDGVDSAAAAATPLQRVLQAIAEPISHEAGPLTVTASAGLAVFPADGETASALLRVADARMYERKRAR